MAPRRQENNKSVTASNVGHHDEEMSSLQIILYGFLFLLFGLFFRQVTTNRRSTLGHHIILVLLGIIVGHLSYIEKRLEDPMLINSVGQLHLLQLFIPMMFFESTFNLEIHYMKTMLIHLILVVIPTLLLASASAIAFREMLNFPMNPLESIVMMTLSLPPGPRMTRIFLSSISAEYDLRVPLEAESLFGSCVTYMFYTVVTTRSFHTSIVYAFPFLLDILLSASFGFIVGKIMIMWISKMFKDIVNQTTIVIAFVYSAFSICQLNNISGFLCIVVIGLVMADRRAVMSTQTTSVLNKFMELTLFTFSSVATVQVGIYLVTHVWGHLTLALFMLSVLSFITVSFIRALVLFITYPVSRLYMNSLHVLYVVCACHLRDSYSCILIFTLIDTSLHKKVNTDLFSILILHIVYSFLAHYPLVSAVVSYVQTRNINNDKVIMLERAAKMIKDLQSSVKRSLKSSMLTTDADWVTVTEYTRLKDDFMKLYGNKAYLEKKRDGINQFLGTQALRKQAVRQIVITERTCYARQFEEGVLSRQSVINLMILVNEALKEKQLVDPYKIVQFAVHRNYFHKLVFEMSRQLHSTILPMSKAVLLLILIFIDSFITMYTIAAMRFEYVGFLKMLFLHSYNVLVLLFYIFLELYKLVRNRSLRMEGPWDVINRIILFNTFIDVTLVVFPLFFLTVRDDKTFFKENPHLYLGIQAVTVTRFIRFLQILRTSPYMQQWFLTFASNVMETKVFIACDMAAGFIQGTMESFRKAKRIVDDDRVCNSIRYVCHLCRLILSQHLGFCQVDNPLVMQALKTKTAIRLALNAQEQRMIEIKEMGLLEDKDVHVLHKILEKKMSDNLSFPTSIGELGHRSVILNLPWVDGNERYAQFIEDNGQTILFSPDDIIVTQGHLSKGIFVILHGLVRVESVIDLCEDPFEPIVEKYRAPYYTKVQDPITTRYNKELVELIEFMTRGNVIGEMSILTGKPGHKTYRCATYVEVFYINSSHMFELMEGVPDNKRPLRNLELRLWRTVSIRQAVRLILSEFSSGVWLKTFTAKPGSLDHASFPSTFIGYCLSLIKVLE
ncbi:sodium/hydrogen exchanger 10-like isoform X3 [Biomphalaria glabrata]|uniref:Sodium/hydrogen exchanger 10-like isoform X3 n=1 Tax=Biomphalaria glabrata TaxID=6526 RepID=A0A9W3BLT3_BIOGL|nr:sodium/hydrogen exchanger 10-like isoform X3 [Biomphalaria glabrata]